MITTEEITVSSVWDSGTHKGFNAGVQGYCRYTLDTLDKHLTKEQITTLECVLLVAVHEMIAAAKEVE